MSFLQLKEWTENWLAPPPKRLQMSSKHTDDVTVWPCDGLGWRRGQHEPDGRSHRQLPVLCSSSAAAADASAGHHGRWLLAVNTCTQPIPDLQSEASCYPITASHLHELTDCQQVCHSDVITTQEWLPAQKHGFQFVQSVVQLSQSAIQNHLVRLRAGLEWDQYLRQAGPQSISSALLPDQSSL